MRAATEWFIRNLNVDFEDAEGQGEGHGNGGQQEAGTSGAEGEAGEVRKQGLGALDDAQLRQDPTDIEGEVEEDASRGEDSTRLESGGAVSGDVKGFQGRSWGLQALGKEGEAAEVAGQLQALRSKIGALGLVPQQQRLRQRQLGEGLGMQAERAEAAEAAQRSVSREEAGAASSAAEHAAAAAVGLRMSSSLRVPPTSPRLVTKLETANAKSASGGTYSLGAGLVPQQEQQALQPDAFGVAGRMDQDIQV